MLYITMISRPPQSGEGASIKEAYFSIHAYPSPLSYFSNIFPEYSQYIEHLGMNYMTKAPFTVFSVFRVEDVEAVP